MAAHDFASRTPRITTRPAVAARIVLAAANLYRTWRNRRAFCRISEMTDAELADIGLTRSDIRAAVALPFSVDPTAELRSLACERAAATEAAARDVA